ncbi:hypothetical protein [Sorangium sp. So ce1024]|uniref:hypothetical protein n=1 Tax=Sorangium sp. So ce1024 TaxID=3133327 RepID=UPI003F0A7DAE
MSRRNPEVERLEHQVDMLRRQLAERTRDPGDLPVSGCGDNSCEVRTPSGGMVTNGGCCCDEREVRRALRYFKRLSLFRQETIRELVAEAEMLRMQIVGMGLEPMAKAEDSRG